MNISNISLLTKEGFNLLKENALYSSLTIFLSFIITNKLIIPLFTSRKGSRSNKFTSYRFEKLIEFIREKKSKNIILTYLKLGLKTSNESENDLNENCTDKIKRTKKIIKKLTEEYIKNDNKTRNDKYDSRKDQIFYLLLNNMHVIKENNENKQSNFIQ